MEEPYEINEKDIESVVRWLKVNDPEDANRAKAIAMLQDLKAGFHQMSRNNPELLEQLQRELERDKPTES